MSPQRPDHTSFRFGRLLAIVVAAFLVSGFDAKWASVTIALLLIALVVVALRATSLRAPALVLAALTVAAMAAAVVTTLVGNDSAANAVPAFVQATLYSILLAGVVGAVVRSEQVDAQTIIGAITAYMMIGAAFASFYVGIDLVDDDQLSIPSADRSQYAPFSFVVLTTLGFGNQVPTAPFAARVVVLQAVTGQIFLTVFIARLVSLYRRPTAPDGDAPSSDPDAP